MPPGPSHNPFMNRMQEGYDHYLTGLEHGEFKNSSIAMKNIFTSSDKTIELPKISSSKNSGGIVVMN